MGKICEITIVLMLVISLFSVLVMMNVLDVKAEQNGPIQNPAGYYETPNADWIIDLDDDKLYENMEIVVNRNLTVKNGGKLTLSNVTLQMNQTTSDSGETIYVEGGGELNVINGSTITTDPITAAQSPDPYEFRIDGTALIENSTVEKMKDRSGNADGIQVYSDDVEITNSTIQLSEGHGVYVDDGEVLITNSNIIDNNHTGVYISDSSNNNIIGNNISSNNKYGIRFDSSSNNIITGNNVSSNNRTGIHLFQSSNNNLTGNNVSSNINMGIYLFYLSNNNRIISNIFSSNSQPGIYLSHSSNNNITGNNASSNNHLGIYLFWSSNNNYITANIVSSNNRDGIHVHHSSNYNMALLQNPLITDFFTRFS